MSSVLSRYKTTVLHCILTILALSAATHFSESSLDGSPPDRLCHQPATA